MQISTSCRLQRQVPSPKCTQYTVSNVISIQMSTFKILYMGVNKRNYCAIFRNSALDAEQKKELTQTVER